MIEPAFLTLVFGLVGLVIGSYLNVLIHRIPREKSTVWPRSSCPYCQGAIRAFDNIPVLSYLVLRGRCRNCQAPISWQYPLIEGLTALLFATCFWKFGLHPLLLHATVFCCLMVVLAAIDVEHFLLPDRLTLPGIAAGLAFQFWYPYPGILDTVLGTLVGAGILILVINYWYWLRGEEGMGIGDVNMLAMIGAFLGWQGVLTTLVLATTSGAIVGLGLMITGKLRLQSRLPFGFFLALGGLLSLFFGDAMTTMYRALL